MSKKHVYLVLFSLLFITLTSLPAFGKMASVKQDKVKLHSGPGQKYPVKWEYGAGFPLKVLSKKKGWVKVVDFENDRGWIRSSKLSSTPHLVVKVNKNKRRKINIRSGPGTRFRIVGKAYYGVVFRTILQQKGWAKVKHESGLVGWVKRTLLWGF